MSQRRNSCSSERNLRKLGAAKNNDVENRWREISKSLVNIRMRNKSRVEVRETALDGSSDLLHLSSRDMRERSKSAVSVDREPGRELVPENMMQNKPDYQSRVQASLDCLDLPHWYKHSSHNHLSLLSTTSPSTTPSWRSPPVSTSSSASSNHRSSQWRLQQNRTNEMKTASSSAGSYTGWRSSLLTDNVIQTPSQRLAKTLMPDTKE